MFDSTTLEGKQIAVSEKHLMPDGRGSDPITLAMNEALAEMGEGLEFCVYPLPEVCDILENNGVVGALMTAGTFDCWFQRYSWGQEMNPCTIHIFLQDDDDLESGEEPDERLWIGIMED